MNRGRLSTVSALALRRHFVQALWGRHYRLMVLCGHAVRAGRAGVFDGGGPTTVENEVHPHPTARRIERSARPRDAQVLGAAASTQGGFVSSPLPESSGRPRPVTAPLVHRLTVPDAIVIVAALMFAAFLCIRGVNPQSALITTVAAVGALVLVVVVPRGVVEIVGLLRELVQLRAGHG